MATDFAENITLQARCKSKEAMANKKTLSITLQGTARDTFFIGLGYFEITGQNQLVPSISESFEKNEDKKVVFRPIITTTDENLRKYSPQQ